MIDTLSLAISHGLLMLAAFLLMRRPDLDAEADVRVQPGGDPGA